jgi:hypothetical protein
MKPTLDLARELASAVLDQVERDRALHDVRIAEAILARMVVCEAREVPAVGTAPQPSDEITKLAVTLLKIFEKEPAPPAGWSFELSTGYNLLWMALRKEGHI